MTTYSILAIGLAIIVFIWWIVEQILAVLKHWRGW